MILDCIGARIEDLETTLGWTPDCGETRDQLSAMADLDMDLREQTFRRDGFGNDLVGLTFTVEAKDFIENQGSTAREQQTLNNRLMQGTISQVDVWSLDGLEDE